jgi:hypothetical protein
MHLAKHKLGFGGVLLGALAWDRLQLTCFSTSGVNFFQRYRTAQSQEIEPPAVTAPPLPNEKAIQAIDTLQPIHVDDAQYLSLTRALRPISSVGDDPKGDASAPNPPAAVEFTSQPSAAISDEISPDRPPGTPIV